MATVESYTKAKIDELIDATIQAAEINEDGELVLTREDETEINLGVVGGGISKVTSFPVGAEDGDVIIRIDLPGDPQYKFTDGVWELSPRMGGLTPPAVRATDSSTVAVPSATETALAFTVEEYDTDAIHDVASNTTKFTAKTPGIYSFVANFFWSGGAGARECYFRKNGSGALAPNDTTMVGGSGTWQGTKVELRLAAGDYIELIAYQSTGSSQNVTTRALSATWQGGNGQTVDERGVPACKLGHSTTQNIPNNATTLVNLDVERYDTDGMHDTVTNNTRITIKTPGLYSFKAQIKIPANTETLHDIIIFKNGVHHGWTRVNGALAATNGMFIPVTVESLCAAGDYFELGLYHFNGSTQAVGGSTEYECAFSATLQGSGKTVTPFARAYAVAAQTLPNDSTWHSIVLDGEKEDNDGIHDTVTNNTRLTCRTAGVYQITGHLRLSGSAGGGGSLQVGIRKNGGTVHSGQSLHNGVNNGSAIDYHTNETMELAVGDYVELMGSANGAAPNLTVGDPDAVVGATYFEMVKVGASNARGLGGPAQADVFTVATLPAAAGFPNGKIVGVSDGAAGQQARMAMNGAWINLG